MLYPDYTYSWSHCWIQYEVKQNESVLLLADKRKWKRMKAEIFINPDKMNVENDHIAKEIKKRGDETPLLLRLHFCFILNVEGVTS